MDLNSLLLLDKILVTGSFSGAGKAVGITKASVSNRIRQLEDELGLRLFERSTRKVRITEEGKRVRALAQPIIDSAREIKAAAEHAVARPEGIVKISVPLDLGFYMIDQIVGSFVQKYPSITIEMDVSNAYVDLVHDEFDLAIRATTSPLSDSNVIAVQLGETKLKFYKSPRFSCANSLRVGPDLEKHLISYEGKDVVVRSGGKAKKLRSRANIVVNDMLGVKQAVLAGLGIGLLPELSSIDEVKRGQLLPIFPRWCGDSARFYALFPSRRYVPRRTKLFIEHLKMQFMSSE